MDAEATKTKKPLDEKPAVPMSTAERVSHHRVAYPKEVAAIEAAAREQRDREWGEEWHRAFDPLLAEFGIGGSTPWKPEFAYYYPDEVRSSYAHALRRAREQEREASAQIAEAEPELPEEPTDAMREALRTRPVECLRAAVTVTKSNIASAIRARGEADDG